MCCRLLMVDVFLMCLLFFVFREFCYRIWMRENFVWNVERSVLDLVYMCGGEWCKFKYCEIVYFWVYFRYILCGVVSKMWVNEI